MKWNKGNKVIWLAAVFALVLLVMLNSQNSMVSTNAQENTPEASVTPMYAGKVRAPEFPDGLDWINVEKPLTMAQLRGKVVMLDFWTYGCINCIHIIPDLKRLETEFAKELVVIGVHSAKFKNEGNTENIRKIVTRYEVDHPVVNDKDFVIWQTYSVRAWPTIMIIDPLGRVLGFYSGEGVYEAVQPILKGMVAEYDAQGVIDRTPLALAPERGKQAVSPLAFPGKVLADATGKRLFITDSNHHRIIVTDLQSFEIKAVIGGRQKGNQDGIFASALFDYPQGLAINGDTLYVADTGNHLLREVDLTAGTVKTIAGTGVQNRDFSVALPSGPALEVALNSPWDIVYLEGKIYIAMAGSHQLWMLDLKTGQVAAYAGSRAEGLTDGPLTQAELAQPSGITTDGKLLYFADSEASAIRTASLDPQGEVKTIVGTGLFDFGDVDGTGDTVRLQHALGVTVGPDGKLYVADTYNSKIKIIDPATRESKTFAGEGKFNEPGGISYANGKLYVADTNNSAVRVIDLATREVTTVSFPNPDKLNPSPEVASNPPATNDVPGADFFGDIVKLKGVKLAPGAGKIVLDVILPEGYKFNNLAPFTLHVYNDNPVVSVMPSNNDLSIIEPKMPLAVPISLMEGSATLTMDAGIIYCEAVNETLCFPANVRFVVPVSVAAGGDGELKITYKVLPPEKPSNTLGN